MRMFQKKSRMKQLQNSNYNEKYRREILKSAINGFNKQKEADRKGETPLYRSRGYKKIERMQQKKSKADNWYTKDGSKNYIMVPSTPGSKLKKMIQKKLNNLELPEKVKVVEKSGQKFSQVMKRHSKQEKRETCGDPKCLIGNTEKGGDCRKK